MSAEVVPFRFSYDAFEQILDAVQAADYRFLRLDDRHVARHDRRFFLRHDIDISPEDAHELGTRAARRGLVSNFFFQLNAETYNVFGAPVLECMRALRRQGHCVGLHMDQDLIGGDEAKVRRTLDWFDSCVTTIDRAVSFHRPSPEVLGRVYTSFVNSYDPRFFAQDGYLSDSRRSLDFWPILQSWLAEGRPQIQLLLHPEWWGEPTAAEVWARTKARRVTELRAYMGRSFSKVFADLSLE